MNIKIQSSIKNSIVFHYTHKSSDNQMTFRIYLFFSFIRIISVIHVKVLDWKYVCIHSSHEIDELWENKEIKQKKRFVLPENLTLHSLTYHDKSTHSLAYSLFIQLLCTSPYTQFFFWNSLILAEPKVFFF